jgi:hypothetical protein
MTRLAASGMDMKNRVTAASVMVTGRLLLSCQCSVGRNDPRLPRTLPKRTEATRIGPPAQAAVTRSASRLVAPSTLVGAAALSVEMFTNVSVPARAAAATTLAVPARLVLMPSAG